MGPDRDGRPEGGRVRDSPAWTRRPVSKSSKTNDPDAADLRTVGLDGEPSPHRLPPMRVCGGEWVVILPSRAASTPLGHLVALGPMLGQHLVKEPTESEGTGRHCCNSCPRSEQRRCW